MPNIVLNTSCNLRCPYCFANDFVAAESLSFTREKFEIAKEFILSGVSENNEISGGDNASGKCSPNGIDVGIIGGEPTLHPEFDEFVLDLCADRRVKHVIIYTNGILIGAYPQVIKNDKVRFLINCNPKDNIGEKNYNQLVSSIKKISKNDDKKMSLGVNIYSGRKDYSYILELLKLTKCDRLRVSITVPNSHDCQDAFSYFEKMKPTVLSFFKELSDNKIVPYFDCNHLPPCFLTQEDVQLFSDNDAMQAMLLSTLSGKVCCHPVIDVFPDLTAARCFGMSDTTRVNIKEFAGLPDLYHYYLREVDALAYNCYADKKCVDCYKMRVGKCSGGCLAYKTEKISKLRSVIKEYLARDIDDKS